jgi:hypothetical protein
VSGIIFERRPDTALLYHVLAHLDLGRDAANLFDPALPRRQWVDGLREAYWAAPGRLFVQAGLLDREPNDATDRELVECLRAAMDAERPRYEPAFAEPDPAVEDALMVLRAALYETTGPPPPLTVLDCPALRWAGRATASSTGRLIAVSLAQDPGHVICQTIHEEIHAVTDPIVRQGFAGVAQDTRADAPGFALHAELERTAIEVGDALVAARAPQWSPAYATWRSRFAA